MKHKNTLLLVVILGLLVISFGIWFPQIQREGIQTIIPDQLLSQFVKKENTPTGEESKPPIDREAAQTRMKQIEKAILEETNDPDRALLLRRELQSLRESLGQ